MRPYTTPPDPWGRFTNRPYTTLHDMGSITMRPYTTLHDVGRFTNRPYLSCSRRATSWRLKSA